MLKDPSVFKVEEDDEPKCAVLVHQDLVDYEDLSRTCQMNREQKLARMSEEQFNAKAECCISESRMLWFLSKGFDLVVERETRSRGFVLLPVPTIFLGRGNLIANLILPGREPSLDWPGVQQAHGVSCRGKCKCCV